jgi:hypothetical protein
MYQAFIDESLSDEEFVLGGYVQASDIWANFVTDWERLLPFGVVAKNGKRQFHMTEMRAAGKMKEVEQFSGVIDKHNLFPISFRMNLPCFRNAISTVEKRFIQQGIEIDWERWSDPYYFGFRHFFHGFHEVREIREALEPEIPLSSKIDFYLDRRSEKAQILEAWSEVVGRMSEEEKARYGETPQFENKQDFLQLQAADFWAWWVRHWYEEDDSEIPAKLDLQDFGGWRGKRRMRFVSSVSEEYVVEALTNMTLDNFVGHRGLRR